MKIMGSFKQIITTFLEFLTSKKFFINVLKKIFLLNDILRLQVPKICNFKVNFSYLSKIIFEMKNRNTRLLI